MNKVHMLLKLDNDETSVLKDLIQNWLATSKDGQPHKYIQIVQRISDAINEPVLSSLADAKREFDELSPNYDVVGETYRGN
tara:strand:- start:1415 stop:1657 length:243 start_codon:yes stop_codon:yes gene_type:complete